MQRAELVKWSQLLGFWSSSERRLDSAEKRQVQPAGLKKEPAERRAETVMLASGPVTGGEAGTGKEPEPEPWS